MTISNREAGARIDQLLLTSDDGFDPGNQVFTFEAEYGGLIAPMIYGSDPGASNNTYTYVPDTASGGSVSFNFNVKVAGTYALQARVKWPNTNENSFFEQVDGGPQATLGNNGNYGVWQSINGSTYFLSAGNHVLTISSRESGAQLDQVTLTLSPP